MSLISERKKLYESAYRYFRHKYDTTDGLDGSWLDHDAFSIKKLLNHEKIGSTEKYALLTAYFQSGKTFTVIDLVIIYLSLGMTPIIVVPKSSDVRQLKSRMEKEMKTFMQNMMTIGFKYKDLKMYTEILYNSSTDKIDNEKFKLAMNRNRIRCIICIKHYTHINRLIKLCNRDTNIVLIIDEAHIIGGYKQINDDVFNLHDDQIKYDCSIARLKTISKKIILQTATAAIILVSESQLWSDNIFQKHQGPWYRGPAQIEYTLVDQQNATEEIVNVFGILSHKNPIKRIVYKDNSRHDFHPINILIHAVRAIDKQKSILRSFHNGDDRIENFIINSDWLIMTFQSEGLRVWHRSFTSKLQINGVKSIYQGNNEHLFKTIQPYQVFDWCAKNGGVDRFHHIATIAYDMTEQGTSLSTINFPHWHLSHLLHVGNTTSSRTAQIVYRLCGNHGDNLPLTAFVSYKNKEKSIKEFMAHDKWIKDLCSLKQHGNFQVSRYLTEKSHIQGHIPKQYLPIRNSRNILKTCGNPHLKIEKNAMMVSNHASEICFAFDKEKFAKDYDIYVTERKSQSCVKNDKFVTETVDLSRKLPNTDEFNEHNLNENLKLCIKNHKITHLIKILKYFHDKNITRVDIKILAEDCMIKNINNFTTWNKKGTTYKLLVLDSDNFYILNPVVIDKIKPLLPVLYNL